MNSVNFYFSLHYVSAFSLWAASVCVSFLICWAPFHMQRLLARYWNDSNPPSTELPTEFSNFTEFDLSIEQSMSLAREKSPPWHMLGWRLFMFYGVGFLYYLSAAINPVLYNVMSREFRRSSLLICRCISSNTVSQPSMAIAAPAQSSCMPQHVLLKQSRHSPEIRRAQHNHVSTSCSEIPQIYSHLWIEVAHTLSQTSKFSLWFSLQYFLNSVSK